MTLITPPGNRALCLPSEMELPGQPSLVMGSNRPPFELFRYQGFVRSNFDGDTCRLDLDMGRRQWTMNAPHRLFGIDAPEMRGATLGKGREAREAFAARCLGRAVWVKSIYDNKNRDKHDHYGRYLALLWDENGCINDWMVVQGFAVPFFPDY